MLTILHHSSDIGTSLYLECQKIWKSGSILPGPSDRDRLLVAYVASSLGCHVQLLQDHLECFNLGIKALSNSPESGLGEIPTDLDGIRKLPERKRREILEQIRKANKDTGIVTPMEQAWHFVLHALPATAIMTNENLLTYIFDSSSAHHMRITDCFAIPSRLTASEIEACMKSLPNDEVSLKPVICTLYNHLRAPDQSAILLNKEENIDDHLTQLVVSQLERLSLHAAEAKASLAAFSSRRGRLSSTRLSTSTGYASIAIQPMSRSRAGTPPTPRSSTPLSQSEAYTDSSDQTGDELRAASPTRKSKKSRGVSGKNSSRTRASNRLAIDYNRSNKVIPSGLAVSWLIFLLMTGF